MGGGKELGRVKGGLPRATDFFLPALSYLAEEDCFVPLSFLPQEMNSHHFWDYHHLIS